MAKLGLLEALLRVDVWPRSRLHPLSVDTISSSFSPQGPKKKSYREGGWDLKFVHPVEPGTGSDMCSNLNSMEHVDTSARGPQNS